MTDKDETITMRTPFPDHQIGKLPKPTKSQTDAVKKDFKAGIRCKVCGQWHHPDVVHLDYVGHAALTDRLLDVDPDWSWEPLAFTEAGLPLFDDDGGLWIKLTVLGMTRYGYGNAAASTFKDIGSRQKEIIGDALRNAAMRFGAALDLWHKGDLHDNSEKAMEGEAVADAPEAPREEKLVSPADVEALRKLINDTDTDEQRYCKYLKVEKLADLPLNRLAGANDALLEKQKKLETETQTSPAGELLQQLNGMKINEKD